MIDIKFMRKMYRLNNLTRYNPWPKHNNESVASHSYYVSLFTRMICYELGLSSESTLEAVTIALLHDTPEALTNDITHDAKEQIPGLDELLQIVEQKFVRDHFPQFARHFSGTESVLHAIVKVADILSVVQFADSEVQLGNKAFESILIRSIERVWKQVDKLESEEGIKCQSIMI